MTEATERRMRTLLEQLQQDPSIAERLPTMEGTMVRAALDGDNVYAIAQEHEVTEGAVWEVLTNAARMATGHGVDQVVTGGYWRRHHARPHRWLRRYRLWRHRQRSAQPQPPRAEFCRRCIRCGRNRRAMNSDDRQLPTTYFQRQDERADEDFYDAAPGGTY
ncbi:MAG: hypothetical protein R2932_17200 [Caldilineaceae bacterium]